MSRPHKNIDWELVDELLIAGCEGSEIAPCFDMHRNTFYDRVALQYGMSFTDYQQEKRSQGCGSLRKMQWDKACLGDTTMMVWLGKNRLKQSDSPQEVNVSPETMNQFSTLMNQLSSLQSARNNADSSQSKESIS
jgi:hypothetical protein